jgi:hypothetical protein
MNGGLRLSRPAEAVKFRANGLVLQLLPIVLNVDHPSADVIGLLGRQEQRQLDLLLCGHAAGHPDGLGLLHLAPSGAFASREYLIRHMRIGVARRQAVYLNVVLGSSSARLSTNRTTAVLVAL